MKIISNPMNLTKVKRIAANLGFGNPLNQLFYAPEEIEDMKRRGLLISPRLVSEPLRYAPKSGRGRRPGSKNRDKVKERYGVRYRKFIVTAARFETAELALQWASWNYRGDLRNIAIVDLNTYQVVV